MVALHSYYSRAHGLNKLLFEPTKHKCCTQSNTKQMSAVSLRQPSDQFQFKTRDIRKLGLKLNAKLPKHQIERRRVQSNSASVLPAQYVCPLLTGAIDQGTCCGSCYAVVLTQVMQDRYNIQTGSSVKLSYTDLLTDDTFPNIFMQCDGGYIAGERVEAYMYSHGLTIDGASYPSCLQECVSSSCNLQHNTTGNRVSALDWIETTDIEEIKTLIHNNGPVAAGFGCMNSMLNDSSWPRLSSPVVVGNHSFTSACVTTVSDIAEFRQNPSFHAISVVGWVTVPHFTFVYSDLQLGGLYWIIRNSWGKSWGSNGFALLPSHQVNPKAPFAAHPHMFDTGLTADHFSLSQVAAPGELSVIDAATAELTMQKFKNAIKEKFADETEYSTTVDQESLATQHGSSFTIIVAVILIALFAVVLTCVLWPKWTAA